MRKKLSIILIGTMMMLLGFTKPYMAKAATTQTALQSSAKNVYGATIDIQNAQRILGTLGYNYIRTDQPGYVLPTLTSNDLILGGVVDPGNKAQKLSGADRDGTIAAIRAYAGIKNVYGAGADLANAKGILGTTGYNYIQTDAAGFQKPSSFTASAIILGGTGTQGGISDTNIGGAIRLWGANSALTAQAINNYRSPKYVYGTSTDIANAKNILGTSGYDYIYTDETGFVKPSSFTSNDIILGGPGTTNGIPDTNIGAATRLWGADSVATTNALQNSAISENVYRTSVDIQHLQRILGTTGFNYIQSDIAGFIKPNTFSSNDIILGGPGTTGGIADTNLNGATRLAGVDRAGTIAAIRKIAGTKNVYGTGVDLANAKAVLGTTGYNYIQTDAAGFVKPSSFTSKDIILGGTGTQGGISDTNIGGAIRLWGANSLLTAQAINNYYAPKYVYGTSTDIANAKNILGTTGYDYIYTDAPGFVKPSSFASNEIILGGTGTTNGIPDTNIGAATRLWGADSAATTKAIQNYAVSKNVYGTSVDIQNARSILGTTGYNYIQSDLSVFITPVFTINDIILGGGIADPSGKAIRLSGANRDLTAQTVRDYAHVPDIQNEAWGYINRNSADMFVPITVDGTGSTINISINTKVQVYSSSGDYYDCYYPGTNGVKILKLYLTPTTAPIGTDGTVYATVCTNTSGTHLTTAQIQANAKYIYNYLTQKGWSKNAICGLLGNLEAESNINPGVWENLDLTTGLTSGFGIVQWTPSGNKFLKWANLSASQVDEMTRNDPKQLMNKELEFMLIELIPGSAYYTWIPTTLYYSPYSMTANEYIHSSYSAESLALVWHGSYERSSDPYQVAQKRSSNATFWYNFFS